MELSQYQVVLVNLDPTQGSEIQKTRPCVVVSPNELNHYLRTVTVVPMTTSAKLYPTRVAVTFDGTKGAMAVDQIRTIDQNRTLRVLGQIKPKEIKALKRVFEETFVK